jgi:hypothetical protein
VNIRDLLTGLKNDTAQNLEHYELEDFEDGELDLELVVDNKPVVGATVDFVTKEVQLHTEGPAGVFGSMYQPFDFGESPPAEEGNG